MAQDDDWLHSRFGRIYPAHVAGFARLLSALRRLFGGDLDLMLVMAVIGDRRYALRHPPEAMNYGDAGRATLEDADAAVINIQSIADFTGIPRETVRRKVSALVARGWVSRDGRGDLAPTAKASTDLRAGTEATLGYLADIVAACDEARRT
jgi:hypothetical protein